MGPALACSQEKALARNKGAAKLAVELRKAERKIVAAHRKATSGKDAAVRHSCPPMPRFASSPKPHLGAHARVVCSCDATVSAQGPRAEVDAELPAGALQVDAELAGLSAAQLLPATLQQAVLDALPSDAEALAAVPGMPAAVAKHFGGIILDAVCAHRMPLKHSPLMPGTDMLHDQAA